MDINSQGHAVQGKNILKIEAEQSTRERVEKYKLQSIAARAYLEKNPQAVQSQLDKDKTGVLMEIEKLKNIFNQIKPYIFKIREYVPNMLDQNKVTASYFLFGKIFHNFEAIFTLARDGFHYEAIEIIRSIKESADLIEFFMLNDDSNPELKKWFNGEIITNEKARNAINNFMREEAVKTGLPMLPTGVSAGIYSVFSKYTHSSYAALLDSFDVFGQDFDYKKLAGFHYTSATSLPCANDEMRSLIITLKIFYSSVENKDVYKELDLIQRKIAPEMYDEVGIVEKVSKLNKKYSNLN